jgi:branched-subunit amino acid aminotransferase/4-amino-4-deoxychorismate lyase
VSLAHTLVCFNAQQHLDALAESIDTLFGPPDPEYDQMAWEREEARRLIDALAEVLILNSPFQED